MRLGKIKKQFAILIVLAALFDSSTSNAAVSPGCLYETTVRLRDGSSIKGYSHGIAGFFDPLLSERRIESVVVKKASDGLDAEFFFSGTAEPVRLHRREEKAGAPLKLKMFAEYELVKNKSVGTNKFYWVKKPHLINLHDINRVETKICIGAGYAIESDPRVYDSFKEPHIIVRDVLGCFAKFYSEKRSLKLVELRRVWNAHFDPQKHDIDRKKKHELEKKHGLKTLYNPTCVD